MKLILALFLMFFLSLRVLAQDHQNEIVVDLKQISFDIEVDKTYQYPNRCVVKYMETPLCRVHDKKNFLTAFTQKFTLAKMRGLNLKVNMKLIEADGPFFKFTDDEGNYNPDIFTKKIFQFVDEPPTDQGQQVQFIEDFSRLSTSSTHGADENSEHQVLAICRDLLKENLPQEKLDEIQNIIKTYKQSINR